MTRDEMFENRREVAKKLLSSLREYGSLGKANTFSTRPYCDGEKKYRFSMANYLRLAAMNSHYGDLHDPAGTPFSRFARDYIEMGDYLEYLFPYLGVRYISINDGYDSNNHKGTTGGLDMVMRAIIYDAYSKDLSIKVKSGKEQGRKKGRRVGGYPGYGYMRDPNRRSMDIIDPEAAAVVRRIFEAAIEGILTPSVYFRRNHPETHKFANVSDKQYWNYDIVRDILKHQYAYTGASVGGTLKKLVPCHKSVVATKAEEWIIVPGMHEAIVTTEEYELAQKIFSDRKFISSDIPSHPLQSIVVCSNCLRVMEWNKRTTRHRCRYGSYGGDAGCRAVLPPPKKGTGGNRI